MFTNFAQRMHVTRKPAETAIAQPVEVVKAVPTVMPPTSVASAPVSQAFGGKTARDFVDSLTIKEWRQLRAALEEVPQ